MITCEFVTRTEKCAGCGKQFKKGFLVDHTSEFVCSEKCAKVVQEPTVNDTGSTATGGSHLRNEE
jgi:hypothetical protein